MTFLEDEPDMTSTVFTREDVERARGVLVQLISEVDPAWLKKPAGPIGLQWKAGGPYPASWLVHLAQVLYVLNNRNVTQKSLPILKIKLRELLRPPARKNAFEELLTELDFAAELSARASPVSFEPMVPEGMEFSGSKPKSPDYGIRLPHGDVAFEVTSVHFDFLQRWDEAAHDFSAALGRDILKRNIRRSIDMSAPIEWQRADFERAAVEVLRLVTMRNRGQSSLDGGGHIKWRGVPHGLLGTDGELIGTDDLEFGAGMTFGGTPGPASAISYRPLVGGQSAERAAVKSVRNSLKNKRRQLVEGLEFVLVVSVPHHRINLGGIQTLMLERIFPNPEYKWLTGVALYRPQRSWESASEGSSVNLVVNENASIPISPSLRAVFEGAEQFHLG